MHNPNSIDTKSVSLTILSNVFGFSNTFVTTLEIMLYCSSSCDSEIDLSKSNFFIAERQSFTTLVISFLLFDFKLIRRFFPLEEKSHMKAAAVRCLMALESNLAKLGELA